MNGGAQAKVEGVSPLWRSTLEVKCPYTLTGAAVGHKAHRGPAVHPSQRGLPQGEELGVDDGEHGLAAAVTVAQGPAQHVQQAPG